MDQLQRFIDLVNRTGDKLVIFDRYQPSNSCVILGINAYEAMINKADSLGHLTEEELADKINHDIAIWKNEHILDDVNGDNFDWPEDSFTGMTEDKDFDFEDEEIDNLDNEAADAESYGEPKEEELSYLYPEVEAVTFPTVSVDSEIEPTPVADEELASDDPSFDIEPDDKELVVEKQAINDEDIDSEELPVVKNDFQSLGDILGSKFERGNNWTIPSDRKRLAEDEAQSRYETIGF